jgi:GntR family transcriptional regulator/MocR family aminotransferase
VTPGATVVAVEEPGYPPVARAFAAAGAKLVSVPVDDEGLCVERLPPACASSASRRRTSRRPAWRCRLRRRAALLDYARRTTRW